MTVPLAGRLLVAMPVLDDPNFARTVVLLLEHDEDGALGVVLNRTSPVALDDALAAWAPLAAEPRVVFGGGPIEPAAVVALGRTVLDAPVDAAVLDRVRLVDLEADAGPGTGELERVRVFAGYAGWAPGQVEAEVAAGAWLVVGAEPGDVFTSTPDELWRDVLRRQPGRARLIATYPEDPLAN
jgi:putative transcriptional regulator